MLLKEKLENETDVLEKDDDELLNEELEYEEWDELLKEEFDGEDMLREELEELE